ncbi:MAG: EamA family transporter, partial [Alphaproteobacteria bacterium]|nr:EamA family transporter [Alphaproteobacteria bacterium]
AYRLGDLSQVYPISRGMAPALVALGAFLLIGESLSVFGWIGLFAVSCGIGFLALQRGVIKADPRAVWVAILLGLCIASYSVADGIGIRLAESPGGYIGWLFLGEAPVPLFLVWWRMRDGRTIEPKALTVGLLGGILAVGAYGIVLYAKTIAPLAAVSAIRESSVIFAALIGLIVFKERPWKGRLVSAAIVASGVITLAIAG